MRGEIKHINEQALEIKAIERTLPEDTSKKKFVLVSDFYSISTP